MTDVDNSSPPHAHDWLVVPFLSFLSAFLLGSVATSLAYSYAIVGEKGATDATWQMLNAVGGFWNGHFGAISLVAVAWGLYLQLHAMRTETAADRERAKTETAQIRQWMLVQLDARRNDLARWIEAAMAWQDDEGRWHSRVSRGKQVIRQTLGEFLEMRRNSSEGCTLCISREELQEYLRVVASIRKLLSEAATSERAQLSPIFESALESTAIESVLAAEGSDLQVQQEIYARASFGAHDPSLAHGFEMAIQKGWRFDICDFSGNKVLTARCLSLIGDIFECEQFVDVEADDEATASLRQLLRSIEDGRTSRIEALIKEN